MLGYSYTIVYKKGKENTVADALSWLPINKGGRRYTEESTESDFVRTHHYWFMARLEADNKIDPYVDH